jgi:2-hydroxychromene-2-carboxylate isomerase
MPDMAVLRAALEGSALDSQRLFELSQDPTVKQELQANTTRSVERGAFGSPTFFVGDDMYFGKDRLRDVEEAIVATQQVT